MNLCYRCKWTPRISEMAQKPMDEVVKYKDYHAYSRLLEEEADHEVDVEVVIRPNIREGKDPGDYIRQDPSRKSISLSFGWSFMVYLQGPKE